MKQHLHHYFIVRSFADQQLPVNFYIPD